MTPNTVRRQALQFSSEPIPIICQIGHIVPPDSFSGLIMPHLQITVKPFSSAEKLLWYFLLFSDPVKANFHILPLNRHCQENIFQSDVCNAHLLILIQTCTLSATRVFVILSSVRLWTQVRDNVSPCTYKIPGNPLASCAVNDEYGAHSTTDNVRPRAAPRNICLMQYFIFLCEAVFKVLHKSQ